MKSFEEIKMTNKEMGNQIEIKDVKIRGINVLQHILNDRLKDYAENLEKIEPETLDWIDDFEKERVFYDIGALSGPFSTYAAIKADAKVVAFEPEAQNFAALEMNHYLNRDRINHPIISLNIALSNKNEIGKLFMVRNVAGATVKILDSPSRRMTGDLFDPGHVQYVLVDRLDDVIKRYKLPAPNYLKIDVDGAESNVVHGAEKTLKEKNVKSLLIELLEPNGKSSEIVNFLKSLGFYLVYKKQVEDYEGLYNCIFKRS